MLNVAVAVDVAVFAAIFSVTAAIANTTTAAVFAVFRCICCCNAFAGVGCGVAATATNYCCSRYYYWYCSNRFSIFCGN